MLEQSRSTTIFLRPCFRTQWRAKMHADVNASSIKIIFTISDLGAAQEDLQSKYGKLSFILASLNPFTKSISLVISFIRGKPYILKNGRSLNYLIFFSLTLLTCSMASTMFLNFCPQMDCSKEAASMPYPVCTVTFQ